MEKSHYSILNFTKIFTVLLGFVFMISSCSSPKYTASFTKAPSSTSNYDKAEVEPAVDGVELAVVLDESKADINDEVLLASASEKVVIDDKAAKLAILEKAIAKINANPESVSAEKMTLAQKIAAKKVAKKINKILMLDENKAADVKDINEANQSDRRSGWGGLLTGIILLVAGLILSAVLPSGLAIIGTIVWIAGIVALVIWLLRFLGVI